jgi:hypothetical protein
MQRMFLKDVGKYKAGHLADWPTSTWKTYFPGYEEYTKPMPKEEISAELKKTMKERKHAKNY